VQAIPEEAVPKHLLPYKIFKPPFYCRLMTPDFDHTMDQVLLPKLRELCPVDELHGNSWSRAYDKRHRVLRFKSGSWFQFNSYKQEVADLSGATLHRIHYDESPPKEHRTESKIRLVRQFGQEIFTLTPVEGIESWLYEDMWEPWERGERNLSRVEIITASMDDNPYLTAEAREWVLEGLSSEEKDARRRGLFRALHGLIYSDFNTKIHVVSRGRIPDNVNIIVGIDPGTRYAVAVVWCAIDSSGRWHIFEELKLRSMNVETTADAIHRINAKWDIDPMSYVIDPSARNTLHQTGRSDQELYAEYGIPAAPGQNDVRTGIKRLAGLLALDKEGSPRLVIHDDCTNLIAEFKKYRWKEPPKSGEETREAPTKKDDHLLDALRYCVMQRPWAPEEPEEDDRPPLQRMMEDDLAREWGKAGDPMNEFGLV